MTSIEPNVLEGAGAAAPRWKSLAGVVTLVASLGGNAVQAGAKWQEQSKTAAEADKLQAETEGLRAQIARERETDHAREEGSVRAWLAELEKFTAAEDRIMVLAAAMETSPYASVKKWAHDQLIDHRAALAARKAEAERLALLEPKVPTPKTTPTSKPQPTASRPTGGSVPKPNLERIKMAEDVLSHF